MLILEFLDLKSWILEFLNLILWPIRAMVLYMR